MGNKLVGKNDTYEVGQKIANAKNFSLYLCKDLNGRQLLLHIGASTKQNGDMSRMAFILKHLSERSSVYEEEYSRQPDWEGDKLHYDWLFPELADSFICKEQGNRHVNILSLKDIEVGQVFALPKLLAGGERVDLKTSAWIFGRFLKLLTFVHEQGIFVKDFASYNILIEPKNHHMVYLLWQGADIQDGKLLPDLAGQDIASAAKVALEILGCGDGGSFLYADTLEDEGKEGLFDYLDLLRTMAAGKRLSALRAFDEFYKLVGQIWGGRKYHPWTVHKL